MKDNSWVLIVIGVIIVIFLLKSSTLETFSLFPDKTPNPDIFPDKTSYIEGDILNLIGAGPGGSCGFLGKAIWIDGKKYGCSGSVYGGGCGYPTGNRPPSYSFCSRATCGPDQNHPSALIENGPPWTFDYGQVEIPLELTAGTHTVEGWVTSGIYQVGCCGFSADCSSGYFRFTINVAPKPCLLQPNQLIAAEMFGEGQVVSQSTLRYPIAQLCSEHPIKVYEKYSRTFRDRYDLFTQLKNNDNLIVPSGESWMIFYIIDNNAEIPAICDPTLYYDVDKKICTDVSGIMTVCSYGQFDPSRGLCVVQADSVTPFCEIGRYDISLNKCIYNPSLYPLCDFCSNLGCNYNYATDRCEYNAPLIGVCPEGTIKVDDTCQFNLPTEGICTVGNNVNGICQYPLPSEGVCSIGTKVGDYCEYSLPSQGVCPSGTTQVGTHCEYELITQPCPSDFLYENGKCVKYPEMTISCPEEYNYNSTINACVKTVPTIFDCIQGGVYENGICVVKIENPICPNGVLSDDKKFCIISPNYQTSACVQGTWSNEKNACIIIPNMDYLCTIGELSADKTSCVIYPMTTIKCQTGYVYEKDLDKCVSYPNGTIQCPTNYNYNKDTGMCEFKPSIFEDCPTNTKYNKERDVCEYSPSIGIVCPQDTTYDSKEDKCLKSMNVTTTINNGIITTTTKNNTFLWISGILVIGGILYLIFKRK